MRHSVRMDDAFGFENVAEAAWGDKIARPWDPPICDHELPQHAAVLLRKHGFTVVVSSPYRRCLQTAGIVARILKIDTVHVDPRVGEVSTKDRWPPPRAIRCPTVCLVPSCFSAVLLATASPNGK